jgi:hypothetical protein
MLIKKITSYILPILFILGTTNCAKMGSLTGGTKDEDPPKVLSSSPENYSVLFNGKKIEINFDEFIQLDNVNQQLVVSPPLGKKPVVKLKNKTLLIELEEDLRENTTYTLNFGGAIKDNNEGNPLTNFEFVFSTGDYLDSLSIGGTLLNAFDLKPSEEPVMVMLYDELSDSVVFRNIPIYVGKSEKTGSYRINNLKADTFKLFALKDVNNNFLFDQPNELIAFLDTTIIIDAEFFSKIAESEIDSLELPAADSLDARPAKRMKDTVPDSIKKVLQDTLKVIQDDSLLVRGDIKRDSSELALKDNVSTAYKPETPDTIKVILHDSLLIRETFVVDSAELVLVDSVTFFLPDSLKEISQDSLLLHEMLIADSAELVMVGSDSIAKKPGIPDKILVDLFLFTEKTVSQFLSNYSRKVRNKLDFTFSLPVSDSFRIKSLFPETEDWYLEEISLNRDTFALWIINEEVKLMDTILLELNYVVKDTLQEDTWKKDSLQFSFRDPQRSTRKKDSEEETVPVMNLQTFSNNATIELNQKVFFRSETPVNYIDTSLISFFIQKDTLEVDEAFNIFKDSINFRKIQFEKTWEPAAKYHFIALPGAFMDVYGATNDTIDVKFSIRKEDYYGILIASVENVAGPTIIQLLDPKETVLLERSINEEREIRFEFMKPGKYKIKLIHDRNGNGKWDTGKYILGIQPEKVEYYKGEIDVRANWEMQINIVLSTSGL